MNRYVNYISLLDEITQMVLISLPPLTLKKSSSQSESKYARESKNISSLLPAKRKHTYHTTHVGIR